MFLYICLIVGFIALDQITKYLAIVYLKGQGTKPLLDGVLHLTYTENSGAAFSILKGKQSFLVLFTSLAMAGIFVYLVKLTHTENSHWVVKLSLAMLVGGGIGNLVDRLRFGSVVDFIDFRIINFAIFNVADVFVVLSVALLFVSTFFIKEM